MVRIVQQGSSGREQWWSPITTIQEHSSVTKALSDTNEDLGLTTEQRSADVEFLRNMRLKCQDSHREQTNRALVIVL